MEKCPDCRRRIRQEGLKDGDDLQSYFVSRIEKWLHARGREMIGWDELLEGGVTPSTIVMSWRGAEGGIKAAKLGNRVVMSPRFYFYLDYYQTSDPESNGEPLSIGRNIPIRKLYGYDPFDELDEAQGRNILGIQANLWTEYVATMDHAEYMLLAASGGHVRGGMGAPGTRLRRFRAAARLAAQAVRPCGIPVCRFRVPGRRVTLAAKGCEKGGFRRKPPFTAVPCGVIPP